MPHKLCKLFSSLLCLGSTRARPAQLNDNKALYQRLFLHLMTVSPSSTLPPSLILSLCYTITVPKVKNLKKNLHFSRSLSVFSALSFLLSFSASSSYSFSALFFYSFSPSFSFSHLSFFQVYLSDLLIYFLFTFFKVEQKYLVCTKVIATYHNLLHAAIIYSCLLHLLELLLKFIVPMLNYLVND